MSFSTRYAMKKRMARGGEVNEKAEYDPKEIPMAKHDAMAMKEDDHMLNQHGEIEEGPQGGMYAEGGQIVDNKQSDSHMLDMVGRIIALHQKMFADGGSVDDKDDESLMQKESDKIQGNYAHGGQVANDVGVAEADKLPAEYDDLVLRDDDMEDADYSGSNSGDELGNSGENERRSDVVSKIMKSRAKRDRMPRPA